MLRTPELSRRSSLHSLCTYLGSFPPELPRRYIRAFTSPGDVVLDPFCGSGTTVLVAREEGRLGIGMDRNPLAVCISRAKADLVQKDRVLSRLSELESAFTDSKVDVTSIPADLYSFFHEVTLHQLAFLRMTLNHEDASDNFLLAALVGILHGKKRKQFGSKYLSVDMPNTFSMSPAYVRRYVDENGLSLRPYDAFATLRKQLESLEFLDLAPGKVREGDSTRKGAYLDVEPASFIFTSPPYLGVLKYGAFNWLRLWLLGADPKEVDASLGSTGSLQRYLTFMLNALVSMAAATRPNAIAILVVGAVRTRSGTLLASELIETVVPLTPWEFVETIDDRHHAADKTTRIWDETRGRASAYDQLIVLKRT